MKKLVILFALLFCFTLYAQEAQAPPITGDQANIALRVLDQATAKIVGTRQEHLTIQQALRTLETYVNEHEPKE
jgi:hypothetical protein